MERKDFWMCYFTKFLDMVCRLLFSAPIGARCGDSMWKNPLHDEGGPQDRQAHHPDHARHRAEP